MIPLIFVLIIIFSIQITIANPVADAVKVTYKLSHRVIAPGDTLLVEFTFGIKKGWHIYWINPGDAGLPTVIEPKDNKIGKQLEVLMDIPKILKEEDLVFYCYENKTKMVSKFIIDRNAKMGTNTLDFDVSWLMCKNECYPGKINLKIPVEIAKNFIKTNKVKIDKYPQNRKNETFDASIVDNSIVFKIPREGQSELDFYPITPGYLVYNQIQRNNTKSFYEITVPLDKFRENNPNQIEGLFVFKNEKGKIKQNSFYTTILIKN